MQKIELSIILPCYNEAENLPQIIEKAMLYDSYNIEVIFVDNGSTDNTQQLLEKTLPRSNKYKIVRVKKNIGYGNGIMAGVNAARGDIIAWTHADLQTDLNDVIEGYKYITTHKNLNSTVLKGIRKGRNIFDTFFTFCMSVISSLYLGKRLNDINAQPKMFHRTFMKHLSDAPDDFSLDLFFLYQAKVNNYSVVEKPVYFNKRMKGESKGGGSIKGKVKLIIRTWKYIAHLKII